MEGIIERLSYEECIAVITCHQKNPSRGLLPPENCIRDVWIQASFQPRPQEPTYPIELFIVTEYDPFIDASKCFFILRTVAENYNGLVRESHRLQHWLRTEQIPTFFRIDPRFGLVYGSFREPVVPSQMPDYPYILIVLVVTNDPAHPELALQDYVERAYRSRFEELFSKYNRVRPRTYRILGWDLRPLLRRAPAPRMVNFVRYDFLARLMQTLVQRHRWLDLAVSVIFTDVTETDFVNVPVDAYCVRLSPESRIRFFSSIEELVRAKVGE